MTREGSARFDAGTDRDGGEVKRHHHEPEMVDENTMRLYGVGPDCPGCDGPTHCVGPGGERPWWCANCNVRLSDGGEYGAVASFPAGSEPDD